MSIEFNECIELNEYLKGNEADTDANAQAIDIDSILDSFDSNYLPANEWLNNIVKSEKEKNSRIEKRKKLNLMYVNVYEC